MTELEKIEYAKTFIDKLANGINPLDDSFVPDGDVVNNVRLSRCFFYVSDILRQVIENGGVTASKPKKQKKQEFTLTEEEKAKLLPSEKPLTITEITEYLNSVIDMETTKKLSSKAVTEWLLNLGVLTQITVNDKSRKLPTDRGNSMGIFTQEKMGQYGAYTSVLYSAQAQQFIYDNIEAITSSK